MIKFMIFLLIVVTINAFDSVETISKSTAVTPGDSLAVDREQHKKAVLESIKGREHMPSDSVFSNIKMDQFKKMSASRLLMVMEMGYSRSLGVSCGHCHVTKDYASEELKTKQTAREMAMMTARINSDLLPTISSFKDKKPAVFVNCTTCHHGNIKP